MDNLTVHNVLGLMYYTFNLPFNYELPLWEFIYYLECLKESPNQPNLHRILTCSTRHSCLCFHCCH